MGLKFKVTKSLTLKTLLPDIQKDFSKSKNRKAMVEGIKDHIEQGKSPVKGKRFKSYSDSYSRIKGRRRPVDMKDTGKMLNSLTSRKTLSSYKIVFKSKIADYHNRLGASIARVIRRLLPTERGERFAKNLEDKLTRTARIAAAKAVSKQNR